MPPYVTPRMRFDAASLPKLPQPMGTEEAMLQSFLNTGNPVPAVQQDWTDEDWQIASLAGDPLGVRSVYDTFQEKKDEQQFIKDMASMDFTSPEVSKAVGALIAKNPRGATKQAMSWMDAMADLGKRKNEGGDDDFLDKIAGYGTEALGIAQEVLKKTGDKRAATAAVADWKNKTGDSEMLASERNKYQKLITEARDAGLKAQKRDYSEEKEDGQYFKDKVEAYKKRFPDAGESKYWTKEQWDKAHEFYLADAQMKAMQPVIEWAKAMKETERPVPPELERFLEGDTALPQAAPAPVVSPQAVVPPPQLTPPAPVPVLPTPQVLPASAAPAGAMETMTGQPAAPTQGMDWKDIAMLVASPAFSEWKRREESAAAQKKASDEAARKALMKPGETIKVGGVTITKKK